MIQFNKVSFAYTQTLVLNQIDLQIGAAERVVILGNSGSGKSSLLRLIAGFEAPLAGEILIDSQVVSRAGSIIVPPHQRGVSMVFQDLALWPHMSVAENIVFGLKIKKISSAQIKQKLEYLLHLVGLSGYAQKHTQQLSGGEQQRVALARAMALSPKILLMDEPLSSLDETLNKHLRKKIVLLQQQFGFTLVYVTHNTEEARQIADRIIRIEELQNNQ